MKKREAIRINFYIRVTFAFNSVLNMDILYIKQNLSKDLHGDIRNMLRNSVWDHIRSV